MIIPVTIPSTLLDLLSNEYSQASKTTIKKWIIHGNVTVNGKLVTNPTFLLTKEMVVEYRKQRHKKYKGKPPYPILFEDDSVLVTVKPAGILTIGERGTPGTSLYKELLEYLKNRSKEKEKLFPVHRLDREVSGIVLFAKSEKIQQHIKDQWHENIKLYYALVEGHLPELQGTFQTWLTEGKDQRVFSVKNQNLGKQAITSYRVLDQTDDYSLLEVNLKTGKKHQIRVHLSESGCPVVGDHRYGASDKYIRRIRLHAFYLSLQHPVTNLVMEFKSPMPRGFLVLKDENEKYK